MQTRLTSARFVGRERELSELEEAFREAADQRPAVALLGGESGVGKTRLIGELERRLADQDALILRGEAVEQVHGDLPYAPLMSALRPLVRGRHPVIETLGRGSRRQLARLFPGLDDEHYGSDQHDPSAQLRLFEALLELLDLLSEQQPLVLVLEDVHWADRSTRTFVAFLARTLRDERLLLLLTYRTDELHRRHALRPLLGELERLERARRIDLEPFDRAELSEALADILDAAPSNQLVERVFSRSEGNPLYSEELLAAGLDGRGAAPQSLRDAFMLRIERLPEDAQRAARAIAVGRTLDEPTITAVTGIEHQALHAALREAVTEQVLMADEEGRLCFRHALLREAAYEDLLPGEREELHLALARTLEARLGDSQQPQAQLAAAVAGHYSAARDQPAALRASVRAALAAGDVHAYGEAADLAERALELWPRVPGADATVPLGHVELLTLAAGAHNLAGDRSRAETILHRALREVDPQTDPLHYSGLLSRLSHVEWSLNRGVQSVETAQRALAMLPGDGAGRERAALLAWVARTLHLRGRFRDAVRDGEEALEQAVAAGDLESEGDVLNTLGMAQVGLGEVDLGLARLRRAISIARENDDLEGVATGYSNLADMLHLVGRTREALGTAQEGLSATPRRVTRIHDWMLMTVAEHAFAVGHWKAARAHLEPPPSRLEGRLLIFRLLLEAQLALGEGDEETAGSCLEQVGPLVESSSEPQWIGAHGALLGDLRRRRRDLLGARAAIAHALDRIELCTDDVMRIARVTAVGLCVEADIAQRARDLRERAQERDALARARIHMQRLRGAAQDGGPIERAWRVVGAAELARARGRDDPGLWHKAHREWDAVSRPYPSAIALWRATEASVAAGDRAAAADAARRGLELAQRLGSRWLVEELTALGERARLELVGGSRPAAAARGNGATEDPFGLTPRELQVLGLLAEGATNRQIGAALYMAEKTASVHVSRILSKLGVHSRTQAAAVAHRLHLG